MAVSEREFVFLQEEVRKLRKRFEHMLSRAGGYVDGSLTVTGAFVGTMSGQTWQGSGGSDMTVNLNRPSVGGTLFVLNNQVGQAANLDVEQDIVVGGLVDGIDLTLFNAAPFALTLADANVPNGRVLTQDHAIVIVDNGAGTTVTIAVDETALVPASIPIDDRYFELIGETTDANLFSGADLIAYSDAGTTKSFHLFGDSGNIDLLGRLRGLALTGTNFLALEDDAWISNSVFLMGSNRIALGIDSNNNSTTAEFIIGRNDVSPAGGNWTTLLTLTEAGDLNIFNNITLGGTVDGVDIAAHAANPDAHHPQSHVLATTTALGADHTVTGLTLGQVLRATGATTARFEAIQATDLPGSFSGFANPTAPVGLTTVNGVATTAMRSDAAPALSQAIIPTWTGGHTFSGPHVIVTGTIGLDYNPGSDIDTDIISVGVTGIPKLAWDESETTFRISASNLGLDRGGGLRWFEGSSDVRGYIIGQENIGEATGHNKIFIQAIKQSTGVDNQVEVNATAGVADRTDFSLVATSGTDSSALVIIDDAGGTTRTAQFAASTGAIKVGINSDIPQGGIGAAMLALRGANASVGGPHIQFTTDSDDYPVRQILPWAHGNQSDLWDAYSDGTNWRSSDATTNFRFQKSDVFQMQIAAGVAQGAIVPWLTAFRLDNVRNITLFSGDAAGTNAQRVLVVRNGVPPTTSPANVIQLYASSGELFVRDGFDNVTPLSPHHAKLFTPDEPLSWVFHHENDRLGIVQEIDMSGLARAVERLSGQKLIYTQEQP